MYISWFYAHHSIFFSTLTARACHHTIVNGIANLFFFFFLVCAFKFAFTLLVNIVYVRPGFIHTKTPKHTDKLSNEIPPHLLVCP